MAVFLSQSSRNFCVRINGLQGIEPGTLDPPKGQQSKAPSLSPSTPLFYTMSSSFISTTPMTTISPSLPSTPIGGAPPIPVDNTLGALFIGAFFSAL